MKIKICGITNKEDALNAIALGASALGFIFYDKSPRFVTPELVEEITYFLPPFVQLIGVFVDADINYIHDTMKRCHLNMAQLHGNEEAPKYQALQYRFIKAFSIESPQDLDKIIPFQGIASGILLDSKVDDQFGGTGQVFDWGLAIKAHDLSLPIILSGGINASNIKKAIELVNPYAIDLSSGVECSPGQKDYNKLAELFRVIKG
eukprot:COSAG01_NODE_14_length_41020_cov_40.702133_32_plen_205_part_00